MIYPQNFEQKTGFDRIRELVAANCLGSLGRERVAAMHFSTDYARITEALERTSEMMRILAGEREFPSDFFFDLRPSLRRIRPEGTHLGEKEAFDLWRSLGTLRDIVHFFHPPKGEGSPYPCLSALAGEVPLFPGILSALASLLDASGRVKDTASADLVRIRGEIAHTEGSLSRILGSILRAAQEEGFVERDLSPTLRDGRLVIPVAPAFRRRIRGIVHDESASGKTLFIEPEAVVEANNRIRTLQGEERREILRILTEFTGSLAPHLLDLEVAYDFLAEVDFIRAKAIFSGTIGALQPRVDNRAQMDFRSALHPLLYLSHRKQGKGVVPLHIPLDDAGRILVVSGPNAGGKSVCLKTAGLLQYMLQCGMPIPVDQGSRGGIFSGIFIDIGDEQSIENDLSTYSSHLRNMKYFLEACNASTLFLIDEFGSGTEPRIGGALAEALLEGFHACGSFGIVTTHYQNLKHLAQRTPGLTNAAMLYDSRRMQPLFQLTVGNPGSSFAMEIARQTGLPEAILASATEKAGVDYVNSDNYLGEILDKKRDLEAKERKLREGDEELNRLLAQSRENLEAMRCERRETLRRAGEEAARILSEANAQIEKTIREIKEAKAEKEPTQKARKALESLRSRTLARVEPLSRQGLPPQAPPQGPILAGDRVRLKGQTAVGRVIKVNDRLATIAFGTLKSVLEVGRLEKAPAPASGAGQGREIPRNWANTEGIREKILRFKPELDVRGMRSDEALQAVSYYIDDACLAGISPVRILHGTGGGVLREIIRAYLRGVDGIARFHDEHVQSGGAGITVVELQKNL